MKVEIQVGCFVWILWLKNHILCWFSFHNCYEQTNPTFREHRKQMTAALDLFPPHWLEIIHCLINLGLPININYQQNVEQISETVFISFPNASTITFVSEKYWLLCFNETVEIMHEHDFCFRYDFRSLCRLNIYFDSLFRINDWTSMKLKSKDCFIV